MRRVVIVGNGFIYHLRDLAETERQQHLQTPLGLGQHAVQQIQTLIGHLDNVRVLFNQFNDLHTSLQAIFQDANGEELFAKLDAVLTWFRERALLQSIVEPHCFEALSQTANQVVNEQILPIVRSFEQQERDNAYGSLVHLLNGLTIGNRVYDAQQASGDQIGVFTTNYDGFLVQLLRTERIHGTFHFSDGFGRPEGGHLVLHEPYISDSNFLAHLHSSYRFGYHDNEIIKTRPRHGTTNQMPILVYMNPTKKLDYIKRHYVLRRYWEEFENWMTQADEVVIYGNSLNSDPHLVRVLNREGARADKRPAIYAAGRTPGAVFARLTFPADATPVLNTIDTSAVGLDRLHEIFTSPTNLVNQE